MQDYAASVQGAAIRVTALNSDGTLATGASACYVTSAFMYVKIAPQYEAGDDVIEKNALGAVCVAYRAPDTLKNITVELQICEPDPELTQLLVGGTLLTSSGKSVGWSSPQVGVDGVPNGVAIEVWSYAVTNGRQASTNPYFHWVLPYVKLVPSSDRTIQAGALMNVFMGYGYGNAGFGAGPTGDWPYVSNAPYQYARGATAPIGQVGYVAR